MIRSYSEIKRISTFEGRYEYLKLSSTIGEASFGYDRYLNQMLYHSIKWKQLRNRIVVRDNGCDLAFPGREINSRILIHHINPVTPTEIENEDPIVFNPENLICVSFDTHNAIHFGDATLLVKLPEARRPNDTTPWR